MEQQQHVEWFCSICGWRSAGGKKWCRECPQDRPQMQSYHCRRSKNTGIDGFFIALTDKGQYTNFARHEKSCEACSPQQVRAIRAGRATKKRQREIELEKLSHVNKQNRFNHSV